METRNCYSFIYVGLLVRQLISVSDGFSYGRLSNQLNELKNALTNTNLRVSLNAYQNFIKTYIERLEETNADLEKLISSDVVAEVRKRIQTLEAVIYSEATITDIYTIPERRFNSEYLKVNHKSLLADGIYSKLPELAKLDFNSSCKCILFGEGTASAFHILRATEETLKHFYFKYKKTKRLKKPMWGQMTSELRNKKNNKPKAIILDSLDLVRTMYRNPTQHPESYYDIESAQDLFGLCIDLINKMAFCL